MKNPTGVDSKEFGLAAGLVFSRYFLKTQHLHYGYWTDDLDVDIANLREAQDRYSDFIVSNIPEGVRSVLDIGCAAGHPTGLPIGGHTGAGARTQEAQNPEESTAPPQSRLLHDHLDS